MNFMGKRNRGYSSGPKRNVVKAIFNIARDLIVSPGSTADLFTAAQDCTLVRTIIDIDIAGDRLASPPFDSNWAFVYHLAPRGTTVAPLPLVAEIDYGDVPDEFMLAVGGGKGVRGSIEDTEIDFNGRHVYKDLKGMRKLKKGDKLRMTFITNTDNIWRCYGPVTMIFKET